MGNPWKTDNWHVSHWNYLNEVRKEFKPPKSVKVHDITLRDGEQQAGIIFSKDDKIRIAEKLAELGVHRIEAGMPAVSPKDEEAIREIVKRNLGPDIFCFARCMERDVKLAADVGAKGIVIEIPASKHLVEKGYQWSMEKAIDLSVKATSIAKQNGLYTVFFTIDATRSDMDWLLNLVNQVAKEGHMDAFTLVDTFGVLSPQAASYFARKVIENVKTPVEVHFHSDFGMGVANTINAVIEGAEVIHTTILGIGERAGNTPMEETVLALLTMYGIDVGIDYSKINEVSKLVSDLSGMPIPPSRPFIGDGAYNIESGIVTGWYKNVFESDPTIVFPVHPDFVGHAAPKILLGKKSGVDNIFLWAKKIGVELSEEETIDVLMKVKLLSHDLRRVLKLEEFQELVQKVKSSGSTAKLR